MGNVNQSCQIYMKWICKLRFNIFSVFNIYIKTQILTSTLSCLKWYRNHIVIMCTQVYFKANYDSCILVVHPEITFASQKRHTLIWTLDSFKMSNLFMILVLLMIMTLFVCIFILLVVLWCPVIWTFLSIDQRLMWEKLFNFILLFLLCDFMSSFSCGP